MSARGPLSHPDSPQNRKMLLAVRAGDADLLKSALSLGAHPDAVATVKNESALGIAIKRGDAELARVLLDAGARVWGNAAINEGVAHAKPHWGPYLKAFESDASYALWPLLWEHRGDSPTVESVFAAAFAASQAGRSDAFVTLLRHTQSSAQLSQAISRVRWMSCALVSGDPSCAREVEQQMGKLTPFEMGQALLHDNGLSGSPDKHAMPCVRYAMASIAKDALALRQTLLGKKAGPLDNCMVLWWIGKGHKDRVELVGTLVRKNPALGRALKQNTFDLLYRAARRGSPAIMNSVMKWVSVTDLEPWAEGLDGKGESQTLWGQMLTGQGAAAVRMGHFALAHGLAPLVNQPLDAKGRAVLHRASALHVSKPALLEAFFDALVAHGARLDLLDATGESPETALMKKGFAAWVARQRSLSLQDTLQENPQESSPVRRSPRF